MDCARSLSRARHDRKLLDGAQARSLPPAYGIGCNGQLQTRPALEKGLQRTLCFHARELVAEAEMDTRAERQVAVGLAGEVELLRVRICLGVHVGRGQHGHDLVTLPEAHTAELDIPP